MRWRKHPASFFGQPKQVMAGERASTLFIRILDIAEINGFGSSLPAEYLEPVYLASVFNRSSGETQLDISRLFEVKLLVADDEKGEVLLNWTPPIENSTERSKRYRSRPDATNATDATPGDECDIEDRRATKGTTREREREKERKRETSPKKKAATISPAALDVANHLLAAIRSHKPDFECSVETWAKQIPRKLMRDDGDRLKAAADFAHRHDSQGFWRPNILSCKKLVKQLDTLEIQATSQGLGGSHPPAHDADGAPRMVHGDGEVCTRSYP